MCQIILKSYISILSVGSDETAKTALSLIEALERFFRGTGILAKKLKGIRNIFRDTGYLDQF